MLKAGQLLALAVISLLMLGVVMVNSALMEVGRQVSVSSVLLSRSMIYMLLAIATLTFVAWFPWHRVVPKFITSPGQNTEPPKSGWLVNPLWIITILMLATMALVYVPGLGRIVNGAPRWISVPMPFFGELSIQPSELAKWGIILLLAWYCSKMGKNLGHYFRGLLPALAAVGMIAGFVVLEDLGTGALLALVASLVLIAGGAKLWHFLMMVPIAAGGVVVAVLAEPYRMARVMSFLDPYADPEGKGYHMIQAMYAVANGQIFGRGLGNGLQKFGYLPEDQTDFIFAIICEELGVPGALFVCTLYAVIIWAGYSIVRKQQLLLCKLAGIGIITTLGAQALINMIVVTGLGPTKGIALPLLSSGGTGWILTCASLGLLIAMDRKIITAPIVAHDGSTKPNDALPVSVEPSASQGLPVPQPSSGAMA